MKLTERPYFIPAAALGAVTLILAGGALIASLTSSPSQQGATDGSAATADIEAADTDETNCLPQPRPS